MAFGKLRVDEIETSTQTVSVDALVAIGTDGDKGDIAVSGSGTVWTIDDGAVDTAALGGDITAAGKALLDDADAAAQRTTLGAEAAGTAASAISTHEAAPDPHPGYALESSLATVATTGAYSDLSGTPTLVANLNDLGDVDLTTTPPADGEALVYDSATGDWVPGAAGGGGTPGGTTGQIQWNSSGSFAGIAGSAVGATGDITLSLNGAASTPPLKLTGTWFSGGTTTTTKPHVLIEPAGTTSTTWNTSGTGLGVNAASGFTGNLLDLQVNGTRGFSVTPNIFTFKGHEFHSDANALVLTNSNGIRSFLARSDFSLISTAAFFGWGNLSSFVSDLRLYRDAAGILAQRNGTNAQTYRLYNTLTGTDVSATGNYERAFLQWNSNVFEIGTEAGSGGGSEQPVRITAATLKLPNLPTYADNTAATSGGLVAGDVYKTAAGELRITV